MRLTAVWLIRFLLFVEVLGAWYGGFLTLSQNPSPLKSNSKKYFVEVDKGVDKGVDKQKWLMSKYKFDMVNSSGAEVS